MNIKKRTLNIILSIVMMNSMIPMGSMMAKAATNELSFIHTYSDGPMDEHNFLDEDGKPVAKCTICNEVENPNKCGENAYWYLAEDGTFYVTGEGAMGDTDGLHFEWAPYLGEIKAVDLAEGITRIGVYDFGVCSNLTSVKMPGVTEIGNYAFVHCVALEDIDLSNITSIGDGAFSGCEKLQTVNLSEVESVGEQGFSFCLGLNQITMPKISEIKVEAFFGCEAINKVEISCNKVDLFNESAFEKSICDDASVLALLHDAFTKYVSIGNGKHKVVCAECDAVQMGHENDSCVGEEATCKEKAQCELCGVEYGELADHKGGIATCTAKAKCTVCGKEYGALATHKYGVAWTSDATNHWLVCSVCNEKANTAAHMDVNKDDKCDTCAYVMHVHAGTLVPMVNATCTQAGVKAYYKCSCGKFYLDAACTKAIADLTAWKAGDGKLAMKAHVGGAATCVAKAKCATCGKEYGSLKPHTYAIAWKTDGINHWHVCSVCGIKKDNAAHTLKTTTTTRATTSADGKKETKCTVCGKVTKTEEISAAKNIKLAATTYVYDGKAKKPAVTVKDRKGNAIATTNYTVSYASGRKNVGKYGVKITFKGDYSGTKSFSFTITPKATSIKRVTAAKNGFTVKWTKQTKEVTGYEIQYATNSKFSSGLKKVTISKNATVSKKITKLKAKKTYYVRIRTYKKVGNQKYTSSWSKVEKVKTK